MNGVEIKKLNNISWWKKYPLWPVQQMIKGLKAIDRQMDGALRFFFRHWGKSRFMVAMSKKAQVLGLEELFLKGPKAFLYFFLFYLIRDTIIYIIIPIYFAKLTSN